MNWLRLVRDALVVVGVLMAVAYWVLFTFGGLSQPVDAAYYWGANPANLYPHPELAEKNGYNYSPAFEFVVAWGRSLPFEVFVAIWRAVLLAAVVYLAGPFTVIALMTIPVASEINAANIQVLLALAVVVGMRHPAAWAFVLLTKVSPGVGLLWFAVRREWRPLVVAGMTTTTIAALAVMAHADQWPGYLEFVTSGNAPAVPPFYLSLWQRLPVAFLLVAIGARRGWGWTVPVAATLALPVFYITSVAMLVGVLPFVREWGGRVLLASGWSLQRGAGRPTTSGGSVL